VDVDFVGHPLLDMMSQVPTNNPESFLKKNNLEKDKLIISLLPGSRKQEIKKMLSIMLTILPEFPDYQFVVAGAPSIEETFYKEIAKTLDEDTQEKWEKITTDPVWYELTEKNKADIWEAFEKTYIPEKEEKDDKA